jgi:serine protease Do
LAVGNHEVMDMKSFEASVAKIDKNNPVSVLFRRGELTRFALIRPLR